jgi:Arc/MetJ-type ribon-helix-helix transcriptional regulator
MVGPAGRPLTASSDLDGYAGDGSRTSLRARRLLPPKGNLVPPPCGWYDCGMTKKIGISLRDELYEWAAREVEDGRAESVSALIAEGLEVLEARSRLESLVADLRAEIGPADEEAQARVDDALRAAEEAQRRYLAKRVGSAA